MTTKFHVIRISGTMIRVNAYKLIFVASLLLDWVTLRLDCELMDDVGSLLCALSDCWYCNEWFPLVLLDCLAL